jgi:hypothetical protein
MVIGQEVGAIMEPQPSTFLQPEPQIQVLVAGIGKGWIKPFPFQKGSFHRNLGGIEIASGHDRTGSEPRIGELRTIPLHPCTKGIPRDVGVEHHLSQRGVFGLGVGPVKVQVTAQERGCGFHVVVQEKENLPPCFLDGLVPCRCRSFPPGEHVLKGKVLILHQEILEMAFLLVFRNQQFIVFFRERVVPNAAKDFLEKVWTSPGGDDHRKFNHGKDSWQPPEGG